MRHRQRDFTDHVSGIRRHDGRPQDLSVSRFEMHPDESLDIAPHDRPVNLRHLESQRLHIDARLGGVVGGQIAGHLHPGAGGQIHNRAATRRDHGRYDRAGENLVVGRDVCRL